jgi:hypothetical protein
MPPDMERKALEEGGLRIAIDNSPVTTGTGCKDFPGLGNDPDAFLHPKIEHVPDLIPFQAGDALPVISYVKR